MLSSAFSVNLLAWLPELSGSVENDPIWTRYGRVSSHDFRVTPKGGVEGAVHSHEKRSKSEATCVKSQFRNVAIFGRSAVALGQTM
jgi:hypothetical protein